MSAINRMRSLGKKYGGKDFITEEKKQKIIELKEQGYSYRKIRDEMNIGLGSISRVLGEVA